MVIVHHLNNSRSQRVLWLLEELGVPYEVKRYERDAKTMLAPPELRAVHPLGKSPVISDGDEVVAESGAIIEYLADKYGQGTLIPAPGTAARRRASYWLHYAEGSLMPPLLMSLIFSKVRNAPMPFLAKPVAHRIADKVMEDFVTPNITLHLDFLEGELGKSTWFGGEDFGVSDIQLSFPLEAAAGRGGLDASRPRLMAFLERIHGRPAYRRALEKGGPYELMR
ncbi:MAG: glutathione S-transferase [Arenimonas sp.]|nr:glutathione S-transferase [Arenimonas sp.]